MSRSDCIEHDFEAISIKPINPYHLPDRISNIPRDKLFSQKWYEITYWCTKCKTTILTEASEEEAEQERITYSPQ